MTTQEIGFELGPQRLLDWVSHRRWQLVAGAIVLFSSTAGLMRIETTGGPPDSFVGALYRSILLFVLNPSGLPSAGPPAWVAIVWLDHFAAPALSASALLSFAMLVRDELMGPERIVRHMRDHVVVCGFGKHGRLLIECVLQRALDRNVPLPKLVIVEREPLVPPGAVELRIGDIVVRAPVIRGDMRQQQTLKRAGVERAAQVITASGDDVVNVTAALQAKQLGAAYALATIADAALSEHVRKFAEESGVQILNVYRQAAENLVGEMVAEGNIAPQGPSNVVIAGFGRFGQMLARALEEHVGRANASRGSAAQTLKITVVDSSASAKLTRYLARREESAPCGGVSFAPIDGDIADLETYVTQAVDGTLTVAICTDDDAANLAVALALAGRDKVSGTVVTRLFENFEGLLALRSKKFHSFAVGELVKARPPESCLTFLQPNSAKHSRTNPPTYS